MNAKIVGEKTVGKWNAKAIESLPNCYAIKYTTKIFESPKGTTYQDIGIKPDVEVILSNEVEPRELQIKYNITKRLELDVQLNVASMTAIKNEKLVGIAGEVKELLKQVIDAL